MFDAYLNDSNCYFMLMYICWVQGQGGGGGVSKQGNKNKAEWAYHEKGGIFISLAAVLGQLKFSGC